MGRKWGPCASPGCPILTGHTYCPAHQPKPWATSTRHDRLPSDWTRRRAFVLERDRHTCYRCGKYADRVDHVIPGDNHDLANLAAICADCDKAKSGHEGGSSQRRYTL